MKAQVIFSLSLIVIVIGGAIFLFASKAGTQRGVDLGFKLYEPSLDSLRLCEGIADEEIDTVLLYAELEEDCCCETINRFADRNYKVVLTLLFYDEDNSDYRLKQIANGYYDNDIKRWARELRDNGRPVILRPLHEFNGDWYPWGVYTKKNSIDDFIPAWRHVVYIFKNEGADNVQFELCYNRKTWGKGSTNHTFATFYPGDDYVDIVGIDGFNRPENKWSPFDDIFRDPYEQLVNITDKPIWIQEMASTAVGGNKSEWIIDAFDKIATEYPRVESVTWFQEDKVDSDGIVSDWAITSIGDIEAFREGVRKIKGIKGD
jgi:hypothetical protein